MKEVDRIWKNLKELKTDAQVLYYWDKQQAKILETLKLSSLNLETEIKIIHRFAKAFNDREKYSSVYYLFKFGYLSLESKFIPSDELNELKFELGRGLHHNRKYDLSKQLFNELGSSNFDTSRIEGWWNQTVFSNTREKVWLQTDLLPSLGRLLLMITYVIFAIKMNEFIISTTVFIILYELYQTWWYLNKVTYYLKEFQELQETEIVKKKIKNKILIELGISLLFYPIYYLNQEILIPLLVIVIVYFQAFHFWLNLFYLPKLIIDLNQKAMFKEEL